MPGTDLAAYAPMLMILLLVGFFGLLVYLRDPHSVAPHLVSRSVWCAPHRRAAIVEFRERVQTGILLRQVHHCPLRTPGERCGQACVWKPTRQDQSP